MSAASMLLFHHQRALAGATIDEVTSANDRKRIFRSMLRDMGGVSEDATAKEFRGLLNTVHPKIDATFYSFRGAVMSDMAEAGVDLLDRKYIQRPLTPTRDSTGVMNLRTWCPLPSRRQHQRDY